MSVSGAWMQANLTARCKVTVEKSLRKCNQCELVKRKGPSEVEFIALQYYQKQVRILLLSVSADFKDLHL